jgi:DNA-binding NarL/FixJ family response regulator
MTAVALDFDVELMTVAPRLPAINAAGRLNLPVALPGEPICLVASANRGLRRRLAAAAELGGWTAHEGLADGSPLSAALSHGPELVVLDLVDPAGGDREALEAFARTLAARPDILLVVCGAADDVEHEVLARELGAFVYVSGVSTGDALVSVFRQAHDVAARCNRPAPASFAAANRDRMALAGR